MIWRVNGTAAQRGDIDAALSRCDFPFELLLPSLKLEGKTDIAVDFEDLSRMSETESLLQREPAIPVTEKGPRAHGDNPHHRGRVLGLFYLPPYTRVVVDRSLSGAVAQEVFLSEGAHAVDYHYMTNGMRVAFWNAIHPAHQDLPPGSTVAESGDLHHGHSWFDGPAGYNTWVGEAWMEGFVRAFAPTVPVTIQLAHPIPRDAVAVVRDALLPEPPDPEPVDLAERAMIDATRRVLSRRSYRMILPAYFKAAADAWLASR